jgi:hypothetical protein
LLVVFSMMGLPKQDCFLAQQFGVWAEREPVVVMPHGLNSSCAGLDFPGVSTRVAQLPMRACDGTSHGLEGQGVFAKNPRYQLSRRLEWFQHHV